LDGTKHDSGNFGILYFIKLNNPLLQIININISQYSISVAAVMATLIPIVVSGSRRWRPTPRPSAATFWPTAHRGTSWGERTGHAERQRDEERVDGGVIRHGGEHPASSATV
jgi:hypothetical protein